ncbi:membrane integrity-associated transporter subunit PqiC [Nitrosomonas sp. PY1]|uniref:PqiC family protein n=1 Tax=Nitrosomonas sp. PY1 TaxID=1803906 RepID=UPI001FC80EBA|nr:PqiC family protein [Nitrosomonas sp. PY1]
MLTGIEDNTRENASSTGASSVRIGLGPVKFPEYLDRSAIIVRGRDPGAEIVINDYHRWAEPLDKNFLRVLSDNLEILLNNAFVTTLPWNNSKDIDYQVIIQVARFDVDLSNKVQLSAHWTIRRKSDGKTVHAHKSAITQTAGSNDFADIVETQSKVTGIFSHEIASELQKIIN